MVIEEDLHSKQLVSRQSCELLLQMTVGVSWKNNVAIIPRMPYGFVMGLISNETSIGLSLKSKAVLPFNTAPSLLFPLWFTILVYCDVFFLPLCAINIVSTSIF